MENEQLIEELQGIGRSVVKTHRAITAHLEQADDTPLLLQIKVGAVVALIKINRLLKQLHADIEWPDLIDDEE
jgi:hypothetical protein